MRTPTGPVEKKPSAQRGNKVDSQSVKTTGVGGERGYDGGKKIKGRKRYLLVDTEGLVLKAKVHVANIVDQERIKPLLDGAKELFPRRWVVERSFAWISHNRRMSKDHEKLCATSEAFVYAAMSRHMLRRLART